MRKLHWAGVIAGSILLAALAFAGILDGRSRFGARIARNSDAPPRFPEFRIGVLGDAQKGLANLRNITRAVLQEKVSLLLQTGDLVSNNDDGHYRLAYWSLKEGGSWGMPRVAPGNHDVKGGPERFVSWCGDLEQSFVERGVAIVLLNNAFGRPPPEPKHVEERIAAAGPHQAVVLLMHQPPFDIQGTLKPEYAGFLAWLEKSKVNYLLCGHEHGYLKKKVGETTLIINGVGGDYDKWQLDQKVCATILDVDGTKITDRKIEIEPSHEVWENIEHLAIGHVAEVYRRSPVFAWLGTLLLGGLVGWGWVRLLRRPGIPKAA